MWQLISRCQGVRATLALVTVAIVLASLEMVAALRAGRFNVPVVPVIAGAALLPIAYAWGSSMLILAYGLVCLAVLIWRAVEGPERAIRDVAGGVFIVTYVPLLASFAALMIAAPDGGERIIVFADLQH